MNDKSQAPKTVEVTLAKAHTHAGKPYAAGAKIQVTEPERDWLAANDVIQAQQAHKAGEK